MVSSAFAQPWFLSRVPGDYNSHGGGDAADYVVWRKGLGTNFTQTDYDVWRAHFGETAGSGSVAGGAVPEPATWGMFLLGTLVMSFRRRAAVS